MYLDYHLKVLLWSIFIFGIIGLAYVGAATTVKEGLEDQSTCNATCACFDKCGPGTYKLPSNTPCTGSSCTASDCCKPNPTCETIKACPSGRQFKSNYKHIFLDLNIVNQIDKIPYKKEKKLNIKLNENEIIQSAFSMILPENN